MSLFCVLEGGDGAGKSYLSDRVAQHLASIGQRDIAVILKDQEYDQSSWLGRRLHGMHELTWSYDKKEPVWEYSREYWLYSLLAWYTLFYTTQVLPAIRNGTTVLTDGWYFKHQARFRMSGIDNLIRLADQLFGMLPQPDVVIWINAPAEVAAARRLGTSKPSEHGAFDTGTGSLEPERLVTYQNSTKNELWNVLCDSDCAVQKVSHLINPEEILRLIRSS